MCAAQSRAMDRSPHMVAAHLMTASGQLAIVQCLTCFIIPPLILIIRWTPDRHPIVPNKLVWRTIARIQITSGVDALALAASHTKFGGRRAASMQGFVTYRRPRLINPWGTMAGIRAP